MRPQRQEDPAPYVSYENHSTLRLGHTMEAEWGRTSEGEKPIT